MSMTLKEELEILRGEPIEVQSVAPEDVPCIETSDAEKLCRHPVVSVVMTTYNHEPYIRQAIEGVMMQQADFEFELIVGEDCSQDKTREICFEYQKRHPDKIRVLWWHENVSKLGGNWRRCLARVRGEFVALCEGDDYWIDPLKLQKQVNAMRRHPSVGLCFCGSKICREGQTGSRNWNEGYEGFSPGLIPSRRYVLWTMFGKHPDRRVGPEFFIMTATVMYRMSVLRRALSTYDIFRWRLLVGDSVLCIGAGSLGDACYLPDVMSVYRLAPTGLTLSRGCEGTRDTLLVRAYYASYVFGLGWKDFPARWLDGLCEALAGWLLLKGPVFARRYIQKCLSVDSGRRLFLRLGSWPYAVVLAVGLAKPFFLRQCWRWMFRIFKGTRVPLRVRRLYEGAAAIGNGR